MTDDEHCPRLIPTIEGRRLSHDMHNAPYYEVSAVTGSHIKDVFEEGMLSIFIHFMCGCFDYGLFDNSFSYISHIF